MGAFKSGVGQHTQQQESQQQKILSLRFIFPNLFASCGACLILKDHIKGFLILVVFFSTFLPFDALCLVLGSTIILLHDVILLYFLPRIGFARSSLSFSSSTLGSNVITHGTAALRGLIYAVREVTERKGFGRPFLHPVGLGAHWFPRPKVDVARFTSYFYWQIN